MKKVGNKLYLQFKYILFILATGGLSKLYDYLAQNVAFDLKYNTKTSSWLPKKYFPISIPNLRHGVRYRASYTKVVYDGLKIANNFLKHHGCSQNQATFVDFGCGKGKVVIQAKKDGNFKEVVGIDYCDSFITDARENLKASNTEGVSLLNLDATTFLGYGDVNVVYLYNPFDDKILARVIRNIVLSGKKTVVIYNKPVHAELFDHNILWSTVKKIESRTPEWRTYIYSFGFDEIENQQVIVQDNEKKAGSFV